MENTSSTILSFRDFLTNHEIDFGDLYVVDKNSREFNRLIKEGGNRLIPLACHTSSSLICSYIMSAHMDLDSQPVAWIDSEGWPRCVFASSFIEFLSLIAYGTGAIYDAISAILNYQNDPDNTLSPDKLFPRDYFIRILDENKVMSQAYGEFIQWLKSGLDVDVSKNPLELIAKAVNLNSSVEI